MKLELRTVFGELIFEGDFSSVAELVKAALAAKKSLRSANLRFADLRSANLRSADLRSANLRSADLSFANLRSADLRSADLSAIKNDFWEILMRAKREVPFLRTALVEGRVNGSSYSGECACLVGTIANARGCSYAGLAGIAPDASRPAERFFLAILPGCTPDKSQHAKLALEWLDEWQAIMDSPALVSAAEPGATE